VHPGRQPQRIRARGGGVSLAAADQRRADALAGERFLHVQAFQFSRVPGLHQLLRHTQPHLRKADQVAVAFGHAQPAVRARDQLLHRVGGELREHLARQRRPDAAGGVGVQEDLQPQHPQAQRVVGRGQAQRGSGRWHAGLSRLRGRPDAHRRH
jgi:hypothetical protein